MNKGKVIFLVSREDVLDILLSYIVPGFMDDAYDCLIKCFSANDLLKIFASNRIMCGTYGITIRCLILFDTRVAAIEDLISLFPKGADVVIKPIQPILDKLEAAGYIKAK